MQENGAGTAGSSCSFSSNAKILFHDWTIMTKVKFLSWGIWLGYMAATIKQYKAFR
jgi:hypothetical protein